jgi:hypothetical protein
MNSHNEIILASETLIGRLAPLTVAGAREIEQSMSLGAVSNQRSSARMKIAT